MFEIVHSRSWSIKIRQKSFLFCQDANQTPTDSSVRVLSLSRFCRDFPDNPARCRVRLMQTQIQPFNFSDRVSEALLF